jgi:hypothetical protein
MLQPLSRTHINADQGTRELAWWTFGLCGRIARTGVAREIGCAGVRHEILDVNYGRIQVDAIVQALFVISR